MSRRKHWVRHAFAVCWPFGLTVIVMVASAIGIHLHESTEASLLLDHSATEPSEIDRLHVLFQRGNHERE